MVLFTIELRSWLHSFWKQQETVCFSAFFCFQGLLVFLSLWPFYHCATWEAPRTICIKMHGDQRDQNVDGKANNLIRLGFGGGGQWCGERRHRGKKGKRNAVASQERKHTREMDACSWVTWNWVVLCHCWLFLGEKSTHLSTSSGVCVCAHTCSESCLTLYNPMEYSLPGILQARILEWGAITSSRGSSQPRG